MTIEIDGSYGEGGGSVVRLAVALSAVSQKPCKIVNIRAGRANPGLQAQHVAAVDAVADLCMAEVKGLELGSKEIEFLPSPSKIKMGNLEIDVGTAGSVALVLQALMIPAAHAESPVTAKIKGGTHTLKAPTTGYLDHVLFPLLAKMGYEAKLTLYKYGFYPRGQGLVEVKMNPAALRPLELLEREQKPSQIALHSVASKGLKLKRVAERMLAGADNAGLFRGTSLGINTVYVDCEGEGAAIDIYGKFENTIIGASAVGEMKKKAEKVGAEAGKAFMNSFNSGAPIDMHAADQLLPYMALAAADGKGASRIKVEQVTRHARTNMWLIKQFLGVDFKVKGKIIEVKKAKK